MKKIVILTFIFCLVFVVLWSYPVKAAKMYISKQFPSNEIIGKAIEKYMSVSVIRFVGKSRTADGDYDLYYLYEPKSGPPSEHEQPELAVVVGIVTLQRLDTSVWIIHVGGHLRVLER